MLFFGLGVFVGALAICSYGVVWFIVEAHRRG